jgi:S1-C subfamily serine protease
MVLMIGNASAEPQSAVCRVNNRLAAFNNVGSGTLIDKSDDGREGLVLTCAHLFSEGVGEVVVSFPGAKTHGAKLVAIDREADLAALAISNPTSAKVAVDFNVQRGEQVKACGFGPQGEYACAVGPIVGEAVNAGQTSALVGDAVRSGDSGGGVFDAEGNLVAVVWGEAAGITYASTGVPLKRFLDRVLGRRTGHVYACPNGMCPRVGFGGVVSMPPAVQAPPAAGSLGVGGAPGFDELERRIAALEQNKQDRGDYVTRGEATQFMAAANERYENLLEKLGARAVDTRPEHAKPRAAELIGITTPTGWGVVVATTIGGWLAGRLLRRGVGGRRDERFQ